MLVDSSDLVIVGSISRVQTIGGGTVTFGDRVYDRLDFRAEIEVQKTFKGQPVPRQFVLDYSTLPPTRGAMSPMAVCAKIPMQSFFSRGQRRAIALQAPAYRFLP